jgi:hypothetical protein
MQRNEYRERLSEAASVLEQPPGGSTGDVIGDAQKAMSTA